MSEDQDLKMDWRELSRQAEFANITPGDIPTSVGGPASICYETGGSMTKDWQPTSARHEGWLIYINPRTREIAVEVDGERLVDLDCLEGPSLSVTPARAREIAAECPLRWQDVRRILEEHKDLGYASWFVTGAADEVADFAWSCWLDAHTEGGG